MEAQRLRLSNLGLDLDKHDTGECILAKARLSKRPFEPFFLSFFLFCSFDLDIGGLLRIEATESHGLEANRI